MGIRSFIIPAALTTALLSASPAAAGLLDSKCHPLGLLGGYRQHDLGDRTFQISVLGNGFAGSDFMRACTLERAQAIASEQGFSRFAIVSFKGSWTSRRGSGAYLNGSTKTLIKLLGAGETAAPLKGGEVIYFDVGTMRPEWGDAPAVYVAPPVRAPQRVETAASAPQGGASVDVRGLLRDPGQF